MKRAALFCICLLALACSSSKEDDGKAPNAVADPTAEPASPSKKNVPATPATSRDESRPDWSGLFASSTCPLTADEVKTAFDLKKDVTLDAGPTSCSIKAGGKMIALIRRGESISSAGLAKEQKGNEECVGLGEGKGPSTVFCLKVELADPTIFATWRGSSHSYLNVITRDRIVNIAVKDPEKPKQQGDGAKEALDAAYLKRQSRAINIANTLDRKAKAL